MDVYTVTDGVRVLALGNDLLADDAFGLVVADRLRERLGEAVEIVTTCESGFRMMDDLLGVRRLIVVDTVRTGRAPPGTLHLASEENVEHVSGSSPHTVGLFDALRTARALGLAAAEEVTVVAVEPADCETIGGAMHPAVESAVEAAADRIAGMVAGPA